MLQHTIDTVVFFFHVKECLQKTYVCPVFTLLYQICICLNLSQSTPNLPSTPLPPPQNDCLTRHLRTEVKVDRENRFKILKVELMQEAA